MAVKADVSKGEVLEAPFRQWSKNGNAAHQFDLWLLNKLPRPQNDPFLFNAGGYQTLNFLSSIATALLGIFCTRLLTSRLKNGRKLFFLLLGGACCLALGLAAGASACPIIKRLWTPSWVLFSGAYVIWMLALFFLLIEILPFKRWAFPLTVLGMNSLAVYVLEETGREMIKQNIVRVHFKLPLERLLGWLAERTSLSRRLAVTSLSPEQYGADLYRMFAPGIEACGVLLVIWLCAYWLYKRQLFLRV